MIEHIQFLTNRAHQYLDLRTGHLGHAKLWTTVEGTKDNGRWRSAPALKTSWHTAKALA
jgi:hypothetical protein